MKKNIMLIFTLMTAVSAGAQTPKWWKTARRAIFSIITYSDKGEINHTGNGFYISPKGAALTDFTLIEGSARGEVVDYRGRRSSVGSILGAGAVFDVARISVDAANTDYLRQSDKMPAEGDKVYVMPYTTMNNPSCRAARVLSADSLDIDTYYLTLDIETGSKDVSCPVLDSDGRLVGMIQHNAMGDNHSYAISTKLGAGLKISPLSASDASLRSTSIPKALPEGVDGALVYLYTLSSVNLEEYAHALDEFINTYPDRYEGYTRRAALEIIKNTAEGFEKAEKDASTALKVAGGDSSQALYELANTVYRYASVTEGTENANPRWNYDRALEYATRAVEHGDNPSVYNLRGDIYLSMGKYRLATIDYIKFAEMVDDKLDVSFLYKRYEAEINCHMYKQAVDDILRCVKLDPNNAERKTQAGLTYIKLGKYQLAADILEESVGYDKTSAKAWNLLGICRDKLGDKKAARTAYRQAVNLGDEVAVQLLKKMP